jgi:hypothetical protein
MRLLLPWLLFTNLVGAQMQAQESDPRLYAGFEGCEKSGSALKVYLYPDAIDWLDGVRQSTHDDDRWLLMKAGDVFTTATPWVWHDYEKPSTLPPGNFYQYHLDNLTEHEATFTLSTYDEKVTSIGSHTHRYAVGKKRTVGSFKVDLTFDNLLFGLDFGPNHLESGGSPIGRSKTELSGASKQAP